jgi:exopolysaccharide biosynthesis WecB/TagA/CpsF family protein
MCIRDDVSIGRPSITFICVLTARGWASLTRHIEEPVEGHVRGIMSGGERVYYLGCGFDTGSIDAVVWDILSETQACFKYVVTPNVHHMVRLLEDATTMRPLYERAWRVFCDSRVLSRLAWFGGLRLPVIPGSDLTAHLIARSGEQRLTIALIGPTAAACAVLGNKYPDLNIVFHTPPMGFIKSAHEIQKCVDFAVQTQASLIFLALGSPQQEILAGRIADHPQARGVGLCIGASIDFLTGKERRAPVWAQRAGLEWLHRLLSDPRRLASRYLRECPRIFYLSYLEGRKS